MVVGGRVLGRTAAAVVAVSVVTLLTSATAYGAQPVGAVTQLPGTAGCFTHDGASEDGPGTCSQARGLAEAESATVSPDGKNVYVGSYPNGTSLAPGFAVFSRNDSTGALQQLAGTAGCLTPDGSSNLGAGTCTEARGVFASMGDGHDLVFTSNGRWAYMAANGFGSDPSGLLIFKRDPSTGALTQLAGTAGCITTNGADQDGAGHCKTDAHLLDASGLTFSSDEHFLYVTGTGGSDQIEVFSRNATTGALSDIQCISQAPAPAGCTTGRVVGDTQYIALTPDGKHAYAGQYQYGMSIFDRNPSTGLLTQKPGAAGCITDDGKDNTGAGTCATGRVSQGTFPLLVAPNGKTLYNGDTHHGLSTFHINSDGTLSQLQGTDGCMTPDGKDNTGASTCATGRAVGEPYGGLISPDGRSLYLANSDSTTAGGVAVFLLDPTTGVATQLAGDSGCITGDGTTGEGGAPGTCANGRALGYGYGMGISPDGTSVYEATDAVGAGLAIYHRAAIQPKLLALRVAPSKLSLRKHKVKLRVSYRLNVADTVTFTVKRNGHRVRGKIVKSGKAGKNRFTLKGKIGGHKLGVGKYQLVGTPARGKPKKTRFRLTR
jgi:DNA-binding beta-propeller fold protein YncE